MQQNISKGAATWKQKAVFRPGASQMQPKQARALAEPGVLQKALLDAADPIPAGCTLELPPSKSHQCWA